MAAITSLRPNRAPAGLLDASGREMQTLPPDVARALLFIDDRLAALGMKFNIECEECSMVNQTPTYVIPRQEGGDVVLVCSHARRVARLETA